jgi:predicted ArsR family transcriptional regulator
LLCEGGKSAPRSLAKLVEKTGLARSTVMLHLRHLEGQTLVVKEEILRGSMGRPKTLYKPTTGLLERISKTKSD